jgi:hypothetical protein
VEALLGISIMMQKWMELIMQFGTEHMTTNFLNKIKVLVNNKFRFFTLLSLLIIFIVAGAYYRIKSTNNKSEVISAQAISAVVSFNPSSQSLPPDTQVGVSIDAKTNSLIFAKIVLTFDQSKVRLVTTPVVSQAFAKIIKVSSLEEANAEGKITAIAGVTPGSSGITGIVSDFISFNISAVSTTPDDQVPFTFIADEMQLVESVSVSSIPLITNSSTYILNPVATPTPTSTPIPTPTNIPTPTFTLTPSPSPTATPTTPAADTIPPTVNITYPANGGVIATSSSVDIQASATDNVRVTRVDFFVNGGKRKCSDTTAPYICSWRVPRSPDTYTIQASAYDSANNNSITQITVTSSGN